MLPDRRESANALCTVLEESVQAHLVSDVPVGVFLSGGIDSSAVVALVSRVSAEKPRTFAVVFQEREFSEASYARQIAERCGADHTEIPLCEGDFLDMLPGSLRAMDQPTMDGVNTYVVSRVVRKAGITVALSGLGGDELFGGYPSFARLRWARWLRAVPQRVRHSVAKLAVRLAVGSPRMAKAIAMLDSAVSPLEVYALSRWLFAPSDRESLCPALPELLPPILFSVGPLGRRPIPFDLAVRDGSLYGEYASQGRGLHEHGSRPGGAGAFCGPRGRQNGPDHSVGS